MAIETVTIGGIALLGGAYALYSASTKKEPIEQLRIGGLGLALVLSTIAGISTIVLPAFIVGLWTSSLFGLPVWVYGGILGLIGCVAMSTAAVANKATSIGAVALTGFGMFLAASALLHFLGISISYIANAVLWHAA